MNKQNWEKRFDEEFKIWNFHHGEQSTCFDDALVKRHVKVFISNLLKWEAEEKFYEVRNAMRGAEKTRTERIIKLVREYKPEIYCVNYCGKYIAEIIQKEEAKEKNG